MTLRHEAPPSIVGIVLVKNEDRFIERVVTNILDFCDEIIVTDNQSNDGTYGILQRIAAEQPKIRLSQIGHPSESHRAIERYAGTNTWIFGVDGDEIYDPAGLAHMRQLLRSGRFCNVWSIFGNVLNCTSINDEKKTASGYLAPPGRPMNKLYNFSLIESWKDCPERLHSGKRVFKQGIGEPVYLELFKEYGWEEAFFRCLHAVFITRSGSCSPAFKKSRLNPAELETISSAWRSRRYGKLARLGFQALFGIDWKKRKYRCGALVTKDIGCFLP